MNPVLSCNACPSYNNLIRSLESANRIIETQQELIEAERTLMSLIADVSLN